MAAAGVLQDRFPEVEAAIEIQGDAGGELTFTHDGDVYRIDEVMTASAGFDDVFSFPMLHGNADVALSEPHHAIITESTAQRLFGSADPVGQTIYRNGTTPYTVAAVAADSPPNTHLPFNVRQAET